MTVSCFICHAFLFVIHSYSKICLKDFRKRSRGITHGKINANEKEVFHSRVFLDNTGYVQLFVEYPTGPAVGKIVKLCAGNQAVSCFGVFGRL